MFRCIPCLRTKGFLQDVTTHMKYMSSHGQAQPMQSSGSSPDADLSVINEMAEAAKRLKMKRMKKKKRQQMAIGNDGHAEGEQYGGPEEEKEGGEPKEEEGEEGEEEEEEHWVAEVDRGVLITFISVPGGGNCINKIHFRKDVFDASEAQKWWDDNHDNILDLYSVQGTQALPLQVDDVGPSLEAQESSHTQAEESNSDYNSVWSSSSGPAHSGKSSAARGQEGRLVVPGRLVEWVVEDQPGVFVTIRSLPDGARELRRVQLSRERFGEVKARVWWEENKDRLHQRYIT